MSKQVRRRALLVGSALLLPWVALLAAFFFMPAVGHVSGDALNYSVTKEVGGSVLGVAPCRGVSEAVRL